MSNDSTPPDFRSGLTRDDLKWSGVRQENARLQRELDLSQRALAEALAELESAHTLRGHLDTLLLATANALKGEPDPRMAHSWHDLPDWSAKLRAVAMTYLLATAPGAGPSSRDEFMRALNAWRDLFGRDLFENALAFAELEKVRPPDA